MPLRSVGHDGNRSVPLMIVEPRTLYIYNELGLPAGVLTATSVQALQAEAKRRFGVNDEDWEPYQMTAADAMLAFTQDAIDEAAANKVSLDLSPESIPQVEAILTILYNRRPQGLQAFFKRKAWEAEKEKDAKKWGAYIGEVMRRAHGGEWRLETQQFPGEQVYTLRIGSVDIYPVSKAYKRPTNGPEDSVSFYYKVLTEQLEHRSVPE